MYELQSEVEKVLVLGGGNAKTGILAFLYADTFPMNTSLLDLGRRRIRMVRDIPASTPTPGEKEIIGLIGHLKNLQIRGDQGDPVKVKGKLTN